ncbi:MAG: tRNA pseudouridine(55) synthase TruB [Phycisphaerae bacterium]
MFGFLNVNKPVGPTSHDAVYQVRRQLPRKTKVGHAGTLDPLADGVLIVCVGPATRLADYVQRAPKTYRTQITLGATSTTDDREGEITCQSDAEPPIGDVVAAAAEFVGSVDQIPPAHSAVHIMGRRAYDLARAGEQFDIPPRKVTIHGIEVLRYEWPTLDIQVRCGSGTYIRSIARDIGARLGVGGYCRTLTRTAVGAFTLDAAVPLHEADPEQHLVTPLLALTGFERVVVSPWQEDRLRRGQFIDNPLADEQTPGDLAAVDEAGRLIALLKLRRPRKLGGRPVFETGAN